MIQLRLPLWQAQIILNAFFAIRPSLIPRASQPSLRLSTEERDAFLKRIRKCKATLMEQSAERTAWAHLRLEELLVEISEQEVDETIAVLQCLVQEAAVNRAHIWAIVGKVDEIAAVIEKLLHARLLLGEDNNASNEPRGS